MGRLSLEAGARGIWNTFRPNNQSGSRKLRQISLDRSTTRSGPVDERSLFLVLVRWRVQIGEIRAECRVTGEPSAGWQALEITRPKIPVSIFWRLTLHSLNLSNVLRMNCDFETH